MGTLKFCDFRLWLLHIEIFLKIVNIYVRNPVGATYFFSSPKGLYRPRSPPSSYSMGTGVHFPGREVSHSPFSSNYLKNERMNEYFLQVTHSRNLGCLWPNLCIIILTSVGFFADSYSTLQRGLRTFSRLWIFELQVICFQNIWATANHVLENCQYLQTSISIKYVGLGHVHTIRTERYNQWAFWGHFSFLTYHKYSPRIENQESWLKLYHSAYFMWTFYSPQATRSLFTLFSTFPIMAGGLRSKYPHRLLRCEEEGLREHYVLDHFTLIIN